MLGAVLIVIVLLVLPVIIIMSLTLVAGALGWSLKADAEQRYRGQLLIELNR